jgi:alcohol dehydrogenase
MNDAARVRRDTMLPFDFQLRTRIVFGSGTIARLGELAGELGARRALVVSDPGVVAAGHTQHGLDALQRAGIDAHLFSDVHQNPTTTDVDNGVRLARRYDPEIIIGLGGGSSMDCAKGINFVHSNGGRMQDYWGVGKALRPMLPMVAVPTTAGTGSETQSFALISDAETRVKMACGDKKASFRIALLDPELTLTQPPQITALTGIDALAHALETYVTTRRNWISLLYSREAWRLLSACLPQVLDDPTNLDARAGMQLGACLSGLAIENSMLGATHALANPLTASHDIVHGQAIGTMLPHVIRFNGQQCAGWYAELWALCPAGGSGSVAPEEAVERLAQFVAALVLEAGLAPTLAQLGIPRSSLPTLATAATEQWTGNFNPRPLSQRDLQGLYEAAYE